MTRTLFVVILIVFLNPEIDYSNYKHINNKNARDILLQNIQSRELLDIYRELSPETRRFTWRRSRPLQQARLDFFLSLKLFYILPKTAK